MNPLQSFGCGKKVENFPSGKGQRGSLSAGQPSTGGAVSGGAVVGSTVVVSVVTSINMVCVPPVDGVVVGSHTELNTKSHVYKFCSSAGLQDISCNRIHRYCSERTNGRLSEVRSK